MKNHFQKPFTLEQAISASVDLLKREEVVALPTETVYGLAGDAFSPKALTSIFAAKKRPLSDPLIIHLLDVSWLDRVVTSGFFRNSTSAANCCVTPGLDSSGMPYTFRGLRSEVPCTSSAEASLERSLLTPDLGELVIQLAKAFWPGPLTLLLPRNSAVPDLVTAGLETVAVRVPAHPLFRKVLASLDRPLAAPSANRFGRISPTTASAVFEELGGEIPLILDGGPCHHGLESTIVWPHDGVLQILRPGPITAADLAPFGKVISNSVEGKAPGSLKSHYAPRKKLSWYDKNVSPQKNIGLLAFSQSIEGFGAIEVLSPSGDLKEAAANLYGALRRLDESAVETLVVEKMPEEGIGHAIMDRLKRALSE
ncbi:MAG: hypothetical protein A3F67_10090 [Verrucomicrobia bacterium RIFCSPHIGHO2_12_FULL_41_10]|nr:MAG: hypothetical protein A3F67_10090 [Verrucomicrobia bacterium RIFCSPHIGHO2_12_FULL_41_10]